MSKTDQKGASIVPVRPRSFHKYWGNAGRSNVLRRIVLLTAELSPWHVGSYMAGYFSCPFCGQTRPGGRICFIARLKVLSFRWRLRRQKARYVLWGADNVTLLQVWREALLSSQRPLGSGRALCCGLFWYIVLAIGVYHM